MRKQILIMAALAILGVAAGLSLSNNKTKGSASQPKSPKCANNCIKAKKPAAATGFFIVDSYQGVL
jgi:hypothetical protein